MLSYQAKQYDFIGHSLCGGCAAELLRLAYVVHVVVEHSFKFTVYNRLIPTVAYFN